MPRISYFFGIGIYMYWNEGHHSVPHFHAHHEGQRAAVDLDGRVIAGAIDERALRLVRDWTLRHRGELEANWERARRREAILAIDPLE